jgi:hypothetical protein
MHRRALDDTAECVARAMLPLPAGDAGSPVPPLRNQCSVTLDEWTSAGMQPYMSTTLHFIDAQWRLRAFTVACRLLPHPHTGAALREALKASLAAIDLGRDDAPPLAIEDLAGITTDGARNVMAVTNGATHQRVRCAAHGIQLALSHAANGADFQAFMKPVNRYYAALAKSPQRRAGLERELQARGLRVLMPVYPVKTRWNSHYDALRRFVDIAPGLEAMTHSMLGLATAADRAELVAQANATCAAAPHVLALLEPFDAWTRRLSAAGSVTLSLVPRAVGELLAVAQAPVIGAGDAARVANLLRASLDGELRRIFAEVLQPPPQADLPPTHLARFLDPRTVGEVVVRAERDGPADDDTRAPYTPESVTLIHRVLACLRERLPRVPRPRRLPAWMRSGGDTAGADDRAAELALGEDIQAYLQRTAEGGSDLQRVDPLAWWRAAAPELPCLAGFARRFLAVPATTAESERLFSLAGSVVSPARARLSPQRVNELVVTRAYYIKALRAEQGDAEADTTDVGEQLGSMLDDGSLAVDRDGYIDAAESGEALRCALEDAGGATTTTNNSVAGEDDTRGERLDDSA